MIYTETFRITNEVVSDACARAGKAVQRAKRVKRELTNPSRDMQMAPKYLELAVYKGHDRFNPAEIAELTDLIKTYGSEISAVDLVKGLLNMGVENDNPLSAGEIKDFLLTTPLLDKAGQMKVMRFMQTIKESDKAEYTLESVRKNNSFEKFKEEVQNGDNMFLEGLSEKELRECYNDAVKHKINYVKYMSYAGEFEISPQNISRYINPKNQEFVYSVAKCKKPELLAEIVQTTGAVPELAIVPDELVQIYELSEKNAGLVQDLVIGFYPDEIQDIVSELVKRQNGKYLSKYHPQLPATEYYRPFLSPLNLSSKRKDILQILGLSELVYLAPIERNRRIVIVDGSFEQGKRR